MAVWRLAQPPGAGPSCTFALQQAGKRAQCELQHTLYAAAGGAQQSHAKCLASKVRQGSFIWSLMGPAGMHCSTQMPAAATSLPLGACARARCRTWAIRIPEVVRMPLLSRPSSTSPAEQGAPRPPQRSPGHFDSSRGILRRAALPLLRGGAHAAVLPVAAGAPAFSRCNGVRGEDAGRMQDALARRRGVSCTGRQAAAAYAYA